MYDLHLQLSRIIQRDLWEVFDAMTYSRSSITGLNITKRHNKKLSNLKQQHFGAVLSETYPHNDIVNFDTPHSKSGTVINLSSHPLNNNMLGVLSRGLNFAPTPKKIPVENIVTSIEDTIVRNKIPHTEAECLRQDISSLLRKSKLPKSNLTKGEYSALHDLRNNKDILVLPADKGNATVVVNVEAYENKILQLLSDNTTYEKVNYNPTPRVTTRVVKLLQKSTDTNMLPRLRPQNPTPPKFYGLPKIHKPNWPLRPIVSQIDSPTYKLSKYLASVLAPFTGKHNSFVKDSTHFVQLLRDVRIKPTEVMVSFDVSSLFTNVPVDETIQLIGTLVHDSALPTECMEGIELCLKNGYFIWKGAYYLQLDGVAMGSPIAPVVANIFMEWYESLALSTARISPRYWWRYVDDIFAVVEKTNLAEFTDHLNNLHHRISITVEEEKEGILPFLDVRVIREADGSLNHTIHRKPTHTDRYLHASSHHHPAHLSSVPRSLINRALRICDPQYVKTELEHVRKVLEANGYNWQQCRRWAKSSERKRPTRVERSPTYLPFVKGTTDKIGYLLRRKYDIRTFFRPPGQVRQMLRSPKDKDYLSVPGVYRVPCDCGKSYVGETRRSIATRLTEHVRSIKNMDTTKSAIAEHASLSNTTHYIRFDKASVLATEKYFIPRKIREAIEINRHRTFNRDCGWTLPSAWIPALNTTSTHKVLSGMESDVVSVLCQGDGTRSEFAVRPSNALGNDRDSSDESAEDAQEASSTPPPPEAVSRRAARYASRSARRGLADAAAHSP